ncbi:MAG: terminase small subunit [Clostridia bacterium]|nr:terminase small subunit [Clostridia bacterium]
MLRNPKWEKFCLEYAKSANAADAYRKAGYTTKNAETAASSARRLLLNADIHKRLEEITQETRSEKIMQVAEMQERLSIIARMEQLEDVVVTEGVDKGVTEAKIIQKRNSANDAIKAITQLAKMQGVAENVNINVAVPLFGGEENLED